jgi:hypothetical protein
MPPVMVGQVEWESRNYKFELRDFLEQHHQKVVNGKTAR